MRYQEFIAKILKESSGIARSYFGRTNEMAKTRDNNQVLTEADLAIGRAIIASIQSRYPQHNIIDEEVGIMDNRSQFTWVIDPIDGTSNFAQGVPTYGIIVGLLANDTPVAGGVALPAFEEIILAEKGQGSFCNGERISVSSETRLLSALVAYAMDGHQEEPERTRDECSILADIVLSIRNLRTSNSVFDSVMVAKGKYGACLNQTSKIWDNVGLQVVIEEAGGLYTDFFGKPVDYSHPLDRVDDNYTICMASPVLHKQVQDIIHKR